MGTRAGKKETTFLFVLTVTPSFAQVLFGLELALTRGATKKLAQANAKTMTAVFA